MITLRKSLLTKSILTVRRLHGQHSRITHACTQNTHLSTIFLPHTYSHFVLAPVSMFKGTYGCAGHYCSLQQICDLSHKHTNTLLLFNEHYSINHSRYQAVDTRALGRQKGGGSLENSISNEAYEARLWDETSGLTRSISFTAC